jgi:hypothetical protein
MRAWRSATQVAEAAMAAASACLWMVVTLCKTFGDFFVSLVQQQLSEELLLVINPKIFWLGLQEFDGGGNKSAHQIIKLAQRKHVVFLNNE